jgi:hypothetical protein
MADAASAAGPAPDPPEDPDPPDGPYPLRRVECRVTTSSGDHTVGIISAVDEGEITLSGSVVLPLSAEDEVYVLVNSAAPSEVVGGHMSISYA